MERENQLLGAEEDKDVLSATANLNRKTCTTILHQASVVRWLSLIFLLESIKNPYASLLVIMRRSNQAHRVPSINMGIVEKLIVFLET